MDRRAGHAFLLPSQYALPQRAELLLVRFVERRIALESRIDLRPIFRQQLVARLEHWQHHFGGDIGEIRLLRGVRQQGAGAHAALCRCREPY